MSHFTTADDSVDFLSQDTTSNSDVTRRHLLIKVPDYEYTGARAARQHKNNTWSPGSSQKNSMLALGDTDLLTKMSPLESVKAENGNDLLITPDQKNYLNFEDDKRHRGSGSDVGGSGWEAKATPPNETAAREKGAYSGVNAEASTTGTGRNLQVTKEIPQYVGWRDHTDGHRITTTRGDKIEVIGGNYKLVSLGRGTGVATYQMSGGIIGDSMEPPGNVTSVTWRTCPTASPPAKNWKWVEQTVMGHVVERFHGTAREESYGDVFIEVTGAPAPESIAGLSKASINLPADKEDGDSEIFLKSDTAYMNDAKDIDSGFTTLAYPTRWDNAAGGGPDALPQPDIYESTWAKSVTSYEMVAGNVKSRETTKGNVNTYSKIVGSVTNEEHYENHVTHEYFCQHHLFKETWHVAGGGGFHEYFLGAMTQFFVGASTTFGFANRFEVFVGAEQQVNVGLLAEVSAAAKLEATVGPTFEAKLGGKIGVTVAPKAEVDVSKLEASLQATKNALNMTYFSLGKFDAGLAEKISKINVSIG